MKAIVMLFTTLIILTGCSKQINNIAIPDFPLMVGNCMTDLDTLLREYVIPIEAQR